MKIPQQRLAALVPECKLMITSEGINTLAVDTANVGMVSVNLPKEQFDEFTESAKVEIGMDVPKWEAMLKIMNDSKSTIEISRDGTSKVRISDGKYTYTLTLLDPNTVRKRPNPPGITLPAAIVVDPKEFSEAIKAMGVVSDKCRLSSSKDGLELLSEDEPDSLRKPLKMLEGSKTRPTRAHEFVFLFAKSGKVQFWTHPTLGGTRKKPVPDYYFTNRQTFEEVDTPPENWKTLTYYDESEGKKVKLWTRRNRWAGWKYFYDAEAIREPASASYAKDKRPKGVLTQHCNANTKYEPGDQRSKKAPPPRKQEEIGKATYADLNKSGRGHTATANKRDVWKIPTTQRKEKHFASFPDKLVVEVVKAGSSEAGCCPRCGAPYFRQVRRVASTMNIRVRDGKKGIISDKSGLGVQYQASEDEIAQYGSEETGTCETLGWAPTCDCDAGDPVPCMVMDPFCGRGTVLIVGRRMGRSGIGIDLNPEYCQMVKQNLDAENDKPGIPAMEFTLCEDPAETEIKKPPCIRKGQITLDEVPA